VAVVTTTVPARSARHVPSIVPSVPFTDVQARILLSEVDSGCHGWRGEGSLLTCRVAPATRQISVAGSFLRAVASSVLATQPARTDGSGSIGGGTPGRCEALAPPVGPEVGPEVGPGEPEPDGAGPAQLASANTASSASRLRAPCAPID
jgi:hypothetical protein